MGESGRVGIVDNYGDNEKERNLQVQAMITLNEVKSRFEDASNKLKELRGHL